MIVLQHCGSVVKIYASQLHGPEFIPDVWSLMEFVSYLSASVYRSNVSDFHSAFCSPSKLVIF